MNRRWIAGWLMGCFLFGLMSLGMAETSNADNGRTRLRNAIPSRNGIVRNLLNRSNESTATEQTVATQPPVDDDEDVSPSELLYDSAEEVEVESCNDCKRGNRKKLRGLIRRGCKDDCD